MLGTLKAEDDGRFALRFELPLAQSRDLVWHVITAPEPLSCWFPAVVNFELKPGAQLRFKPTPAQIQRFNVPQDQTGAGQITQVKRPEVLEFTWNDEVLRWELRDDGKGGTVLIFTNIIADRTAVAEVAAAWHAGLEVVKAQLEGKKLQTSMWERAEELAGDYANTMG
ncbi:MAG TPA: hypothetical protein DGG94_02900 [Micromonosporaceae bacterium]|nr:hypothetical protein [Micromonosporaceae bacterium]HCU48767.1 hypothetical protein [Micromonosporaceae bacterium]